MTVEPSPRVDAARHADPGGGWGWACRQVQETCGHHPDDLQGAAAAIRRKTWHPAADEFIDNTLDAFDLQAEVTKSRGFLVCRSIAHAVQKNLDILGVDDTQINQPHIAILPVQSQDFLAAKLWLADG